MFSRFIGIIIIFFAAITICAAQNTKENADFKLAINLFNDKLFDLSLEQFKQFISTYPSHPQSIEAKFYIALANRAIEKNDDARASFQNFALTYPEHARAAEAWWNIGEMFSEEKRYADAASAFERIKVFNPKSKLAPKALLTASDYFDLAGDADNAKRCLRSLVSDYSTNELVTIAHAHLGTFFARENNLLAARKELLLAVEGGGDKELKASVTLQLGKIAEAFGTPAEAEALYRSIIEEKKSEVSLNTTAQAKLQLGRLYFSSGRQKEAIDLFQKLNADSLKLSREIVQQSSLNLGSSYLTNREFKKAADAYERSLRRVSDSSLVVPALLGVGRAYEALKEYRKSLGAYSAIAELPTPRTEKRYALLRAATLSSALSDYEAAVRYFSQYAELFPSDEETPEILYRTGELYRVNLRDPHRAIDVYTAFLLRYPQHEKSDDATYAIASAHEALQETNDALQSYDDVMKKYPASTFALQARDRRDFLKSYKSPDNERTLRQLALLIGDLILEKQKSELAMRLGDIYLNVLQDFPQAAVQYQKASTLGGVTVDSLVREEAAYKRTIALRRQSELDSSYVQTAINAFTTFLKDHPAGRYSDDAAYNRFLLQTRKAGPGPKIGFARDFLKDRSASSFASKVYLVLGNSQKEKGLLNESIETFRQIAYRYPTQPEADEATAQLGIQLAHLGRSDTAAVVLSSYLRAYPRGFHCADVLYEMGMLSAREENPLIAATSFEQLRTKYFYTMRSVDCIETLAQCYEKTRQFDRAITLYRQQLDRQSSPLHGNQKGRLQTVLKLARAYEAANDTANARRYFLDFVGEEMQSPDASDAFRRLGAFEQRAGRSETAIRYFEKSVAAQRSASTTAELASLYYANGDFPKAIEEYGLLAGLSDVDSSTLRSGRIRVVASLYRSGKNKEAEQRTTEFLKAYGADKNALAEFEFEKAMALFRSEEYDRSLAILQAFRGKYDSTEILPQAYFWIGKILEAKELPDSAMKQYDFVMRTFPRSEILPKVYLAFGNIYFFKEKYDEAVKYYRLIVDKPNLSPELLPFAMNNLSEAYKEVGLYDGALELTRNFIERYPNDESILDKKVDLGVLYQKLGYYDQAIVQLQGLLETTNKDLESEIRYYLGESYYYKGEYQQAILEFLKVPYLITKKTKIDWTPNSYYMSAQSYEKMGKYDQALNMYQQIIDKSGIDPAFKTAAQKEINRVKSSVKKDSN
jgi:TolA-binding protein